MKGHNSTIYMGLLVFKLQGLTHIIISTTTQAFRDLEYRFNDPGLPLKISEEAVLGKGGYGFVCAGELPQAVRRDDNM